MKNLKSLQATAKVTIEQGEELLHQEYPAVVDREKVENIIVGVDGGSTQTRVSFMRLTDELGSLEEVYVIPSALSILYDGVDLKEKSTKLYDNLETTIIDKALSPYNVFDKVRVIRGTKLVDYGQTVSRINSSVQKVDTPAFYINIIDSIGYGLVMDCAKRGMELAGTYNVSIACSLPPDDVKSVKNQETFLKYIKNLFIWNYKGQEVNINIVNCYITTEPEASGRCAFTLSGEEIPGKSFVVDGGGRSIGSEILIDGKVFDKTSIAYRYGGTQLIQDLAQECISEFGGTSPSEESLKEALRTGLLRKGRSSLDISELIRKCKDRFARTLFADIITQVFDSQRNVALEDIETIVFSGRLFNSGDYDYSIKDEFLKLFKEKNPEVEVISIEDSYLIPIGNAIIAYLEFGKVLEGNGGLVNPLEDEEDYEDEEESLEEELEMAPSIEGEEVAISESIEE